MADESNDYGCDKRRRLNTEGDRLAQRDVSVAGIKDDAHKIKMELIDAYGIEELGKVLTFGAQKYAEENWRKGISVKRLIGSSCRHLIRIALGEDIDPETGLQHAHHLMCNAMFIGWMLKYNRQWDDRRKNETVGN